MPELDLRTASVLEIQNSQDGQKTKPADNKLSAGFKIGAGSGVEPLGSLLEILFTHFRTIFELLVPAEPFRTIQTSYTYP